MLNELKSALSRADATLWQDALGAVSLVAMLLVALNVTDLV